MSGEIISIYNFGKILGEFLRSNSREIIFREETKTKLLIYSGSVALKAIASGYVAPGLFKAVFTKVAECKKSSKLPRQVLDVIDDPIKGIVHWYDEKLKAVLISGLQAT